MGESQRYFYISKSGPLTIKRSGTKHGVRDRPISCAAKPQFQCAPSQSLGFWSRRKCDLGNGSSACDPLPRKRHKRWRPSAMPPRQLYPQTTAPPLMPLVMASALPILSRCETPSLLTHLLPTPIFPLWSVLPQIATGLTSGYLRLRRPGLSS